MRSESRSLHLTPLEQTDRKMPSEALELLLQVLVRNLDTSNKANLAKLVGPLVEGPVEDTLKYAEVIGITLRTIAPPEFFRRMFPLARLSTQARFFVTYAVFAYVKGRTAFPLLKPESGLEDDEEFLKNDLIQDVKFMHSLEGASTGSCDHLITKLEAREFQLYASFKEDLIAMHQRQKNMETKGKECMKEVRETALKLLLEQGLSPDIAAEIFSTWIKCHREKLYFILSNMRTISSVAAKRSNTIATLVKEFGIYNFARYGSEMLLRQHQQIDQEGKYFLILHPKTDNNGAFNTNRQQLNRLAKMVPDLPVRVAEAASLHQVVAILSKLKNRYGEGSIAGAIVGAHGAKDHMLFGQDLPDRTFNRKSITLKDFSHQAVRLFSQYLAPFPTIVFLSCSTGLENSLAQKFSSQTTATVIAPTTPTNLYDVTATYFDDMLHLNAEYVDSDAAVTYAAGQKAS